MKYRLNCFVEVLSNASLILLSFFYCRHQVVVVNNVYFLNFIVFFSSSIIKNFHWPSSVALLYSIGCLLNDMYVFDLLIIKSRMWMNGVGLCAYAHYRASLFVFNVK